MQRLLCRIQVSSLSELPTRQRTFFRPRLAIPCFSELPTRQRTSKLQELADSINF